MAPARPRCCASPWASWRRTKVSCDGRREWRIASSGPTFPRGSWAGCSPPPTLTPAGCGASSAWAKTGPGAGARSATASGSVRRLQPPCGRGPTLLLDEPTNHVDAGARRVIAGLRRFRGIGLLVSREAARRAVRAVCLRQPPTLVVRPGPTRPPRACRDEERAKAAAGQASTELEQLRGEAVRHRRVAAAPTGGDPKRSLAGTPTGAADRPGARGAGRQAGIAAAAMEGGSPGRRRVEDIVRKRYALDFRLPGTPSPRRRVLALPPGVIRMPGGAGRHPALAIAPDDRIAVVGLGRARARWCAAWSGAGTRARAGRLPPQEVGPGLRGGRRVPLTLPREQGRVLTIVSALGSNRRGCFSESRQASPGGSASCCWQSALPAKLTSS